MSITGTQIRREVGKILKEKDADAFWQVVNSGTSSSQITDTTNLSSTRFTSQKFQDYYVRESDASGSAPDGEKVYARTLTASTGVLLTSPDFTAALAANDALEMWREFDPDTVDSSRDRALSQLCTRWRLTPLSWVVDPDFLVDDLADTTPTNWTGTNATATVTNRSGLERFSERVLRVAASGAGAYAAQSIKPMQSANTGGEVHTWFFGGLVQADVGVATPILFDATNTTTLTSVGARTSWAGEGFQLVKYTAETAATTESISLRLGVTDTTGDCYYGPVCVYPTEAREFVLPARIFNRSRVGLFYEYVGNDWPERDLRPLATQPQIIDVGGGQVKIVLNEPVGARMVFYEEFANYAALQTVYNTSAGRRAGDAATTDCPLEYAAWATLRMLLGEGAVDVQWQRVHQKHGAKVRVRMQRDWVA